MGLLHRVALLSFAKKKKKKVFFGEGKTKKKVQSSSSVEPQEKKGYTSIVLLARVCNVNKQTIKTINEI